MEGEEGLYEGVIRETVDGVDDLVSGRFALGRVVVRRKPSTEWLVETSRGVVALKQVLNERNEFFPLSEPFAKPTQGVLRRRRRMTFGGDQGRRVGDFQTVVEKSIEDFGV